jgi:hypothetical protein
MNDNSDTLSTTSSAVSERSISGVMIEGEESSYAINSSPRSDASGISMSSEFIRKLDSVMKLDEVIKSSAIKKEDNEDGVGKKGSSFYDKHKSHHLGENLSTYETKLYEYASYSLMEEVDICYCKINNKDFMTVKFDESSLCDKVLNILEKLEMHLSLEEKEKILQQLYLLSMGEYIH